MDGWLVTGKHKVDLPEGYSSWLEFSNAVNAAPVVKDHVDQETEGAVEFREAPSYPNYFVSSNGYIRSRYGRQIRGSAPTDGAKIWVMRKGVQVSVYRFRLLWDAWPELAPTMSEGTMIYEGVEWKIIPEFPDYYTTIRGAVLRLETMRQLKVNDIGEIALRKGKSSVRKRQSAIVRSAFGQEIIRRPL